MTYGNAATATVAAAVAVTSVATTDSGVVAAGTDTAVGIVGAGAGGVTGVNAAAGTAGSAGTNYCAARTICDAPGCRTARPSRTPPADVTSSAAKWRPAVASRSPEGPDSIGLATSTGTGHSNWLSPAPAMPVWRFSPETREITMVLERIRQRNHRR